MNSFSARTFCWTGLLLGLWLVSAVSATDLDTQRGLYLQAKDALKTGRTSDFQRLKSALTDYPLYPYLLYNEALKRLSSLSPEQAIKLRTQLKGSVLEDEFFSTLA